MNRDSSTDFDPLQSLLANAFAVQESGIDPDCLADSIDLQRSLENGAFDLGTFIERIVERARSVAHASGTAIGLLEGDELVYQAAAGSAASYVGRRVIATLTNSTTSETTIEILRVENADADPRLQASICRQFGAKSLLILPVCCDLKLWGVLQIFFDQPHVFSEREVRTYNLLIAFLAGAITSPPEVVHESEPVSEHAPEDEIVHLLPPPAIPSEQPAPIPLLGAVLPVLPDEIVSSHSVPPPQPLTMPAISNLAWRRAWDVGVAAVALIAVAVLLARQDRPATTASNAALPVNTHAEPLDPNASSQSVSEPAANGSLPATATKPHVAAAWAGRAHGLPTDIQHFGSDVTVRYFTPKATVLRTNSDAPEIRRLSDDVTIRYFNASQPQ